MRGLKTEWFQLVTEAIFDPNFGLWQPSSANQMCMQINPASGEFFFAFDAYGLSIIV